MPRPRPGQGPGWKILKGLKTSASPDIEHTHIIHSYTVTLTGGASHEFAQTNY